MAELTNIDPDAAWAGVLQRDRRLDGRFVTGVLTTGIYCRPSCPARHPARGNVRFFDDAESARLAGLRPCRRCLPDAVARDEAAVRQAVALLETGQQIGLQSLADAVGYAPHHFSRLFKRATGVTPTGFARALRSRRLRDVLDDGGRITDAVYDAGYSGPSRFYADADQRIGMTPGAWRRGGEGVTIRWARVPTSLGPLLVAATERGICRVAFDEDAGALRSCFPRADILPADEAMQTLAAQAVGAVEQPGRMPDLPLDVQGTAFQEAVWDALRRIPPGETLSYAALAARAGNAGAVRAAGTACGANPVAVLIPCHRAKRTDGGLGGYAWGLERKEALLVRESEEASGIRE